MRLLFDLESNGLLNTVTKLHCIVAKDLDTLDIHVFRPEDIEEGLAFLASADYLTGHNIIGYDLPCIRQLYPEWKPKWHTKSYDEELFDYPHVGDTIIESRLIWSDVKAIDWNQINNQKARGEENIYPIRLVGSHSLEAWGQRLNFHKGDFGKVNGFDTFTEEMLAYCIQDVELNHKLYLKIQEKNYSPDALRLELEFAELMARMERQGVGFDEKKAEALYAELAGIRSELTQECLGLFPPQIVKEEKIAKRGNKKLGRVAGEPYTTVKEIPFNPTSRQQVASGLIDKYGWEPVDFTEKGEPKLDNEVLSNLPFEEAKPLSRLHLVVKRLGQLGEGNKSWMKCVRNGRIHGRITTNGTPTARCRHSDPNLAQAPRVKVGKDKKPLLGEAGEWNYEMRSLFFAPEGYKLIGADASGLELRVLGHFLAPFDGGAFIDELLNGDVHQKNCESLQTYLPEVQVTRNGNTKTGTYARLYGAGDKKLGSVFLGHAPKDMLMGVGLRVRQALAKSIKGLEPLEKALKKKIYDQTKAGKKFPTIRSVDGRIVPVRSVRAVLNTLCQTAGAIVVKEGTVRLAKILHAKGLHIVKVWFFVLHIHDEMQKQAKAEIEHLILAEADRAFREAGEHFRFRCPIAGEAKSGSNWAETH